MSTIGAADEGKLVNARRQYPKGLLFAAAASGKLRLLVRLLDEGMDVDATNALGETALIVAARARQIGAVRILVQRRANLSHRDRGDVSVLMHASETINNADVVKSLLDLGADVNARDELGRTALTIAAAAGARTSVRVLLDHGASIDHATSDDETALTFAIVWNRTTIVRMLIAAGADVNRCDRFDWAPLDYARQQGNARIIELLMRAGAHRAGEPGKL